MSQSVQATNASSNEKMIWKEALKNFDEDFLVPFAVIGYIKWICYEIVTLVLQLYYIAKSNCKIWYIKNKVVYK